MVRVRSIYTMRRVFHSITLKAVIIVACSASMFLLVSVPHVVANMSRLPGLFNEADYLLASFMHTSRLVEGAVILSIASGVWLVLDIVRNVRYSRLAMNEVQASNQ